ncbi:NBR1-Ig-like domain-containing protein [Paracidovorax wautersii]|uniref:Helix-turn-helix n=1 Tax=Paracidovorax wautersii TaxID=1177982 RepID=A0A1I2AGE0_9BURK|nr:NBR1-Ig-like domain-containing protein [Paracidovorax wautersii]SFE43031.1 Helix-turn-helix [Paracidovorax wautersii]
MVIWGDALPEPSLKALMRQRSRDLGKTFTALAAEAGLARTYLYKLAADSGVDPSIGTLARLAHALQVSPVAVLRHYVALGIAGRRPRPPVTSTSISRGIRMPADAVVFNADITIPDHMAVRGGEAFRKVWEVQNVGQAAWAGRRLIRADDEYVIARSGGSGMLQPLVHAYLVSMHREVAIPYTPPGGCVRLTVDFVAPSENCSVASIWRIHDAEGRPCFGPEFFLQTIVTVLVQ